MRNVRKATTNFYESRRNLKEGSSLVCIFKVNLFDQDWMPAQRILGQVRVGTFSFTITFSNLKMNVF